MLHYAWPYFSCMLIHCKRLPAGNGGVKLNALQSSAQEGWCVYICDYRSDLSPYTDVFVMQTKGGTLQTLWYFMLHISQAERVRARRHLKHPATLEVTCFPLRTVYLHRDIFPKAFDSSQRQTRVSFFFLHPEMISMGKNFVLFWAKYYYSFAKKLQWRLFLPFILSNGPWKSDMGRHSIGNERRHVCFTEWVEFTYLFLLGKNDPAFK